MIIDGQEYTLIDGIVGKQITLKNANEVAQWCNADVCRWTNKAGEEEIEILLQTSSGIDNAYPEDYIIQLPTGEFEIIYKELMTMLFKGV